MDIRTIAHLGRYREIVGILLHYGFDEVVERLDLPGRRLLERFHPQARELNTWERIRKAIEELGPAFIKAGQFLSMRHDLLPTALLKELQKLQDEVPPEPFPAIRRVLETSLGKPLSEVFLYFEEEPLAAASLAQVHRAMLQQGRQVVAVKVQRPGIPEIVRTDLEILEMLARRITDRMEGMRVYNLPQLMQQIRRLMLDEIDFSRELRNMRIMRSVIGNEPGFFIPAVFPEFSTPRVLTMELARGRKLKDIDLDRLENREELAKRGISMVIKQILEKGIFHADPHPGNFLIDTDGTISLLDWGMVGRLPAEVRYDLIDLVQSFVENDTEEIVGILLEFVSGAEKADRRLLENAALETVNLFHHLPLKEINLGQILNDTTRMLRDQGLILSADLAIMVKSLVTGEGTARQIYPELDAVAEVEPYIRRLARERYKFANLRRNLLRDIKYLFKIQKKLPGSILEITDKIQRGDITIRFRHENLEGFQRTFEEITNRMILGIITSALFIIAGIILYAGTGPSLWGYPLLGVVSFMLASFLSGFLIIGILRSKKY